MPGPETPVPVAAPAPLLDDSQLRQFRRRFGSRASVAVLGAGTPVASSGSVEDPLAWSTIKLVQAVRAVRDAGGVARLPQREKADIVAALRRSDNAAARRLWDDLVSREGSAKRAARGLQAELGRAGDRKTRVALPSPPSFPRQGETRWQPTAQVRFMDSLSRGCLLPGRDTRWVLKQMGSVVQEQRWGLLRSTGALAKGGWGPHDGVYQVRQVGVMQARGGGSYAVAVTARPRDGSFASGTAILDRVATWLERRVVVAPPAAPCP